jgi:hypothetical protein
MFDTDPILDEVEAFLATSGMAASVFGTKVLRDPSLVLDLRRGRELKLRTRARVRAYIEVAS